MRIWNFFVCTSLSLALFTFTGCTPPAEKKPAADQHDDHAHDHPSEGPHGGHLIELGNEEFHAELHHDDASKTVAIYILDKQAKNPVAIEETELTLNKNKTYSLSVLYQDREQKPTVTKGTFTWDASVNKWFVIREGHRLNFRFEMFNWMNHTVLANPSTNGADANFGRVTGVAVDPRNIQFGLKYLF